MNKQNSHEKKTKKFLKVKIPKNEKKTLVIIN